MSTQQQLFLFFLFLSAQARGKQSTWKRLQKSHDFSQAIFPYELGDLESSRTRKHREKSLSPFEFAYKIPIFWIFAGPSLPLFSSPFCSLSLFAEAFAQINWRQKKNQTAGVRRKWVVRGRLKWSIDRNTLKPSLNLTGVIKMNETPGVRRQHVGRGRVKGCIDRDTPNRPPNFTGVTKMNQTAGVRRQWVGRGRERIYRPWYAEAFTQFNWRYENELDSRSETKMGSERKIEMIYRP